MEYTLKIKTLPYYIYYRDNKVCLFLELIKNEMLMFFDKLLKSRSERVAATCKLMNFSFSLSIFDQVKLCLESCHSKKLDIMELDFSLNITPVAKGRPRFTREGRAYTPKKTKEFEKDLKRLLLEKVTRPYVEGLALSVTIEFMLPRPKTVKREYPIVKPDLDNYIKAVFDAMNGVVWHDDSQVVEVVARKEYAESDPSIRVIIAKYAS